MKYSRSTILQGRKRDRMVVVHPKVPTRLQFLLGQVIHSNGNLVLFILRMVSTDYYTKQNGKV